MKSPFPGMDPYLESRWSDVYVTLIVCISETIQPMLPSSLRARIEERLVLEETDEQPDRFVKIIDVTNGNRVVTAIEVLSPGNKSPGRLNEDYRRKLNDYALGEVSVVEIDLLRSPRGRLKVTDLDLPAQRRTPYLICVRRGWMGERWEVYSVPLRQAIPPVRVPLRKTDADVVLELQPLIERVYVGGGHDDIDYSKPPEPPLAPEDQAWVDELLRSTKRR